MHSSLDWNYISARRMLQPPSCHPNCTGPGPDGGGGGGGGSGTPLTTAAGIALTGGYIYNALAGGNVDAVESELGFDVCFSHPSPANEFHYHYWSACLRKDLGLWSDSQAPNLCRDSDDCLNEPATFMQDSALSD